MLVKGVNQYVPIIGWYVIAQSRLNFNGCLGK